MRRDREKAGVRRTSRRSARSFLIRHPLGFQSSQDSVRRGSLFPFYRGRNRTTWQVASDQAVNRVQLVRPSPVLKLEPRPRGKDDIFPGASGRTSW